MKKLYILLLVIFLSVNIFSQKQDSYVIEKRAALTIGIMQGGGSLVGVDFEAMIGQKFAAQVGAGAFGFGAGLNYHFKPSVRSSFLSLQYWHQGLGSAYYQAVVGPTFVYRFRKLFTAQLGLGYRVEEGPSFNSSLTPSPIMLLYSIGIYFPL